MRCGEERTQDCVQSLSRSHLSGQMSALRCLPFYRSPHRSGRSRSRKRKERAVSPSPRIADRMSVSLFRPQVLLRGCLSISVSSCWALCDPGSPFFVHGGASVSGLDHCPAVIRHLVLHASLHSPHSASARDCVIGGVPFAAGAARIGSAFCLEAWLSKAPCGRGLIEGNPGPGSGLTASFPAYRYRVSG